MTKIYCDRCGNQIAGGTVHKFIYKIWGIEQSNDYCKYCYDDVLRYLNSSAAQPSNSMMEKE